MGRVLFVMTLTLPVGARPSGIMYEGIAIFLADLPIADLDSEINVWIRTCQEFRWGAILLSQWCHQVLNLADSHCLAKKRATSVHLQRISYIWHWLAGRLSWPVMPKTNQFSSQDIRLIEATEKRRRMANGSTLPCRTICLNWWSGNLLLNDITRRITNPTTRSQVFPSSLTLAPPNCHSVIKTLRTPPVADHSCGKWQSVETYVHFIPSEPTLLSTVHILLWLPSW